MHFFRLPLACEASENPEIEAHRPSRVDAL
jgi:hypothetical protein